MKKLIHLVYVPFTGLGSVDFKGNSWFSYRADIFRDYTLKSLTNQTTKDFVLWVSFRPEEKENPITKQIEQDIKNAGLKYILTFDGVMMWDDRGLFHNKDLKERMEKSLSVIKGQLEPAEYIFKTDLGSDDIFSKEALEEIQKQEPKLRGALYYLNGYVLDMVNMRLADWNRPTPCSKYTIMYPCDIFFDAEKHLEYVKGLESHEFIPKVFDAVRLPDKRYMAGVHRANISTTWENQMRGQEYGDIDKREILKNFGIIL